MSTALMQPHLKLPGIICADAMYALVPGSSWQWQSIDGTVALPALPHTPQELTQQYDLCITGEGLSYLLAARRQLLLKLIPCIQVFARVAPKQKVRLTAAPWLHEQIHTPGRPISFWGSVPAVFILIRILGIWHLSPL